MCSRARTAAGVGDPGAEGAPPALLITNELYGSGPGTASLATDVIDSSRNDRLPFAALFLRAIRPTRARIRKGRPTTRWWITLQRPC